MPERAVAEALVEALGGRRRARALIVRARREGRDVLPDGLRARGAEVDVARRSTGRWPSRWTTPTARRRAGRRLTDLRRGVGGAPSSAAARGTRGGPRLVSIGPVTSAALREPGLEPDVEAAEHTPDGLVAALLR